MAGFERDVVDRASGRGPTDEGERREVHRQGRGGIGGGHVRLGKRPRRGGHLRKAGGGYQLIQGWFAIAAGGLFGEGPGQSNASHIPEASTDLIFAVIADELGLVGASALLFGYLLMVGTGLRVAMRCDRPFEKLLATGLSLIIGVQTFVIVGGVTRLIPLTGITLPFVSYGGSSLIANYILLALLLRISHDTESPALLRDDAAGTLIGQAAA